MPIYNPANKGQVIQRFMQNLVPLYHAAGLAGHTGLDNTKGYGQPIVADNSGYVYKVIYAAQSPSHWQAVYMLVPYPEYGTDCFLEVCSGHHSRVVVQEGQNVAVNQLIGFEGNFGDLYANGIRITAAMQKAGDKRGSHEHLSYRPVRLIRGKKINPKGNYLTTSKGILYRDALGVYEICINNAQTKGYIDPEQFTLRPVANTTDIQQKQLKLISLLQQLKKLITK